MCVYIYIYRERERERDRHLANWWFSHFCSAGGTIRLKTPTVKMSKSWLVKLKRKYIESRDYTAGSNVLFMAIISTNSW